MYLIFSHINFSPISGKKKIASYQKTKKKHVIFFFKRKLPLRILFASKKEVRRDHPELNTGGKILQISLPVLTEMCAATWSGTYSAQREPPATSKSSRSPSCL